MQQYFEHARENMVERQIRPQKVTDESLLQALRSIPREQFFPPHLQGLAYVDENVALGNGHCMMEPVILARLLQAAGVQKTDRVLDVGCGTGYASVLLGCVAKKVIGLDKDKRMVAEGVQLLERLQMANVLLVQQDDLSGGYPEKKPYQVILINGAVSVVDDKIKSQLAEGGRLVTVIAHDKQVGSGILITRHGNNFVTRTLFEAATPFLAGFEAPKSFVF